MLEKLLKKIKPLKRSTWLPLVEEGDGGLSDSKFAGTPWLNKGDKWPICPMCNKPLQFFLQLNLDELLEGIRGRFGSGILQMFYCLNCEPECCEVLAEAWWPFAKSELIRVIQPTEPAERIDLPDFESPFPPKRIVGWEQKDDYPHYDDLREMKAELTDDEIQALWDAGYPRPGEKLGGYPLWVQSLEYPNCPICDKRMELVFQIDSEQNLPTMWGDAGIGHITQCPEHKAQVAFGWACH
ncbi:MAG: DUF1963 domain-containing protein [Promethearchaeota archaeon]